MSINHKYKIGQKIRSLTNGQEYFIIGIRMGGHFALQTQLIVHFEKDIPSRHGFVVLPSQMESCQ